MNAHDIDWTQAPEGYDYYIVDTYGGHESRFHYLETDHGPLTDIFGEIYVDEDGQNWVGDLDRIEIYKRPEQGDKPLRLRCLSTNGDHYTKGEVYKVLKRRGDSGSYVVETDDNLTLIIEPDTLTVAGFPNWGTFEIVSEELEDSSEITHLRCVDTNDDDASFTLGSVYGVVEDNTRRQNGHYLVRGDDNMTWAITKDALEFAGDPDVGKFEAAYVGDSVQASDPTPKTQPEFGDIVHVQGKPYVFIRVDEDGDYCVVSGDGNECYLDINDMDEYTTPTIQRLRGEILRDLCYSTQRRLEDHTAYDVSFTVPDFIDFIIEHKDNWEL